MGNKGLVMLGLKRGLEKTRGGAGVGVGVKSYRMRCKGSAQSCRITVDWRKDGRKFGCHWQGHTLKPTSPFREREAQDSDR